MVYEYCVSACTSASKNETKSSKAFLVGPVLSLCAMPVGFQPGCVTTDTRVRMCRVLGVCRTENKMLRRHFELALAECHRSNYGKVLLLGLAYCGERAVWITIPRRVVPGASKDGGARESPPIYVRQVLRWFFFSTVRSECCGWRGAAMSVFRCSSREDRITTTLRPHR